MNQKQLFFSELGTYVKAVSKDTPIGVCTLCGSIRAREDVNGREACPAILIEHMDNEALPSLKNMNHKWKAATSKEELEALLGEHFSKLKDLASSIDKIVEEKS